MKRKLKRIRQLSACTPSAYLQCEYQKYLPAPEETWIVKLNIFKARTNQIKAWQVWRQQLTKTAIDGTEEEWKQAVAEAEKAPEPVQ